MQNSGNIWEVSYGPNARNGAENNVNSVSDASFKRKSKRHIPNRSIKTIIWDPESTEKYYIALHANNSRTVIGR